MTRGRETALDGLVAARRDDAEALRRLGELRIWVADDDERPLVLDARDQFGRASALPMTKAQAELLLVMLLQRMADAGLDPVRSFGKWRRWHEETRPPAAADAAGRPAAARPGAGFRGRRLL